MPIKPFAFTIALMGGLAACGDTTVDQAIIGAAGGAGAAAIVSGSVVTGAAVGAAGNLLYCQTYPGKCN